ncbi:hypothetical protein EC973_001518 [Apophysomyces ossiformis]|uniref:UDP-glycosyltransferases domain-containing protein n=1 Tax=Apophysomyces ossiformis TaxID=679940 RepID=A0A8H7EN45_9FUNG|nr:hypothetical protein EC973_001518 [Apophysomyces ossiformis]
MKWTIRFISLLISLALCLLSRAWAEQLQEDFRSPKTIVFSATMGGASHVKWVLSILNELAERGHHTIFLTKNDHKKFAKDYPKVNVELMDPQAIQTEEDTRFPMHEDILLLFKVLMKKTARVYGKDYLAYRESFEKLHPDVVICDYGHVACMDAADTANLPFIATFILAFTEGAIILFFLDFCTDAFLGNLDSSAPYINADMLVQQEDTTLHQSFGTRFYNKFIVKFAFRKQNMAEIRRVRHLKAELGVKDSDADIPRRTRDSLKIMNSFYGIEPARPMGPLVELVGPILTRTYDSLTEQLQQFLDTHPRVAYIAFGQHAVPTYADSTLLLTALFENIEQGTLDGFLWAGPSDGFPSSVTTLSGKTYLIADLFTSNQTVTSKNALAVQWAPQQAVLHHPSVIVFVSHGGLGSLFEALFARKRLVIFPFFGDQLRNARKLDRDGVAVRLTRQASQAEATQAIRKVVLDEDGSIQANVERYKAMVQIHSKHGSLRGADLVEEVLFTNINGKLPHRYEVARQMSFIKAHNLDLYFVLGLLIFMPALLIWRISQRMLAKIKRRRLEKKLSKIE